MIQSLPTSNRDEIACRIIRTQILPGPGRCPNGAEGSGEGVHYQQGLNWADNGPSVASRHLPVPGRVL